MIMFWNNIKIYIFDFSSSCNLDEGACRATGISEHEAVILELDFGVESWNAFIQN